jgi:hypothetical protein
VLLRCTDSRHGEIIAAGPKKSVKISSKNASEVYLCYLAYKGREEMLFAVLVW